MGGYKQIPGSHGILYVKRDGTAYYKHDDENNLSDQNIQDIFQYNAGDNAGNQSESSSTDRNHSSIEYHDDQFWG